MERISKDAKIIDRRKQVCSLCGAEYESFTYDDDRLISRVTGKRVRFSDHKCPELEKATKNLDRLQKELFK